MFAIQFTRPFGGYNPGEIAGFEKERAEEIIARGAAVPFGAPKTKVKTKGETKTEGETSQGESQGESQGDGEQK